MSGTTNERVLPARRAGDPRMVNIRGPLTPVAHHAERILRTLPDWFGIESSLLEYARNADGLATFVAEEGEAVVGFVSLREHFPASWEIDCIAVQADARGRGVGRALLAHAESWLATRGAAWLQVKTLAASHPSRAYGETRRFYEAAGFAPLEVLPALWGEGLPVQVYLKTLKSRSRMPVQLRPGAAADAQIVSALATQVFLDTYATEGVRPDLAREAFGTYSAAAFAMRLRDPTVRFVIAGFDPAIVGFAEARLVADPAPDGDVCGAELVRLYVQPRWQGQAVGRMLLCECERLAREAGLPALWLTAWEGNDRALAFYRRMGYADVGVTTYSFEGGTYPNRVLAKTLA